MINVAPHIRIGLYTLLSEGLSVPVYENEGNIEDAVYVEIAETNISTDNTVHSFGNKCEQLVEVVSHQTTYARKKVDEIGSQIFNLLTPNPRATGLTAGDPSLQIMGLKLSSQNYLTEDDGSGVIIRLLLRYTFLINEY